MGLGFCLARRCACVSFRWGSTTITKNDNIVYTIHGLDGSEEIRFGQMCLKKKRFW